MVGTGSEHIYGNLDMHRGWPRTAKDGERPAQNLWQLVCSKEGMTESRDPTSEIALSRELMQTAFTQAQLCTVVDRGDHQHRNGILHRLPHRSGDVGHSRSRDDEADSGLPGDASKPIGHESRALLMAGRDVSDPGCGKPTIELDGVDTRYAEYGANAVVALEQTNENFSAGRHVLDTSGPGSGRRRHPSSVTDRFDLCQGTHLAGGYRSRG